MITCFFLRLFRYLSFIGISFSPTSCIHRAGKEEIPDLVAKINVADAMEFNIDSLASFKRLVPLETNDSSMIASLDKVIIAGDWIVVLDKKADRALLFSESGDFIRQMGRKGNGPGEYVELTDMYFDEAEKVLYFFDRLKSNMILYSIDGQFIREIHSEFTGNSFFKGDGGFWLYYSYKNNPERLALLYVDEEMKRINGGFFPYKDFQTVLSKSCFPSGCNDVTYFYHNSSNIIYRLEDGMVRPGIEIDFGDRTIPYKELLSAKTLQEYDDIMNRRDWLGDLQNVRLSCRYCYFEFSEVKINSVNRSYLCIFDTESQEVEIFDTFSRSEIICDFTIRWVTDDDDVVYSVSPSRFQESYPRIIRDAVPDISFDDNPILVFYQFKGHQQER